MYVVKIEKVKQLSLTFSSDRAGIRTQDPFIKSEMLYQLSYQVLFLFCSNVLLLAGANIKSIFNKTRLFLKNFLFFCDAHAYVFNNQFIGRK
jgi:hypothetical protein